MTKQKETPRASSWWGAAEGMMGADCVQEVSSCHGNRYWRAGMGAISAVAAGLSQCGQSGWEKEREDKPGGPPDEEEAGIGRGRTWSPRRKKTAFAERQACWFGSMRLVRMISG